MEVQRRRREDGWTVRVMISERSYYLERKCTAELRGGVYIYIDIVKHRPDINGNKMSWK